MSLQEAIAARYAATGRWLSQRITALWPRLSEDQRDAIAAERTEDGLRALLDAYAAGLPRPVYRTVYQIEVFSSGPYESRDDPAETDLQAINDDITDGDCVGDLTFVSQEPVPPAQLREHLLRIGNDGSCFDPVDEDGLNPDHCPDCGAHLSEPHGPSCKLDPRQAGG